MSHQAAVGASLIAPCRRDPFLRVCFGPPDALPHDITLPSYEPEVHALHDAGHHGTPTDSPAKCPICQKIVNHIVVCRPCQATLVRCVQADCQSAWNPFESLISRIANAAVRTHYSKAPAFQDEAREKAAQKGMELVFRHDPERILTDSGNFTGLLKTAMRNEVTSFFRRKTTGEVTSPGEDHGDDNDLDSSSLVDTIGNSTDGWEDPAHDLVVQDETVRNLQTVVENYYRQLGDVDALIFRLWSNGRTNDNEMSSQTEIAAALAQALEADGDGKPQGEAMGPSQATVSRRITALIEGLAASMDDPTNGLDYTTRSLARELFLANKRTRRTAKAPATGDSPIVAEGTHPTTHDNSESHDA